jgi:hypothetical protein
MLLYIRCPVANEVWWRVLSWANCPCTSINDDANLARRKGVNTLFMIVGWHIWKERNARLDSRAQRSHYLHSYVQDKTGS